MLRTMDLPPRTMIIRKGQQGDCMYFIAAGEVEVDLPGGKKVRLKRGRILRRDGAARQQSALGQHHHHAVVEIAGARPRRFPPADGAAPDLGQTIDAEATGVRALENK